MNNSKIKTSKLLAYSMYIAIFWFAITFLIYPNLNILRAIFFQNGTFKLDSFTKLFSSARAVKSLKNSFVLASTMIVTVNIIGVFLVLVSDYFDIKGAKWLKLGYMTTLIYGGVVLVSGYRFVYGETGIMTKMLASIIPNFNKGWFEGYLAVVLALLLGIATLLLLTVMIYFEKKGTFMSISKTKSEIQKQKINNSVVNIIFHILAYALFLLYIIPVVFVVIFSFSNSKKIASGTIGGFTLNNYIGVFSNLTVLKPFITSVVYSFIASLLVVILALNFNALLSDYDLTVFLDILSKHPVKYMYMPIVSKEEEVERSIAQKDINLVGFELLAEKEADLFFDKKYINSLQKRGYFAWMNAIIFNDVRILYAGYNDNKSILEGPEKGWKVLIDNGADVIQTDWPQLLSRYLGR